MNDKQLKTVISELLPNSDARTRSDILKQVKQFLASMEKEFGPVRVNTIIKLLVKVQESG